MDLLEELFIKRDYYEMDCSMKNKLQEQIKYSIEKLILIQMR